MRVWEGGVRAYEGVGGCKGVARVCEGGVRVSKGGARVWEGV